MHNVLRLDAFAGGSNARRLWPFLLSTLSLWRDRSRSRRQLALLDDRALADVGLSRAEQWKESRKRFWQA
ncbi:DUF1127 domain-containing protein [Enhydrobacter sp.]|jgi:uncharacterized protein YjiS (DUF1127 family)|uniref:DUF1127 domain-containing protein n=1 Tax=Enhydrobacter sp. TaxID=1894999 RepID=UPI00261DA8A7|nr:DUF1127 domain-containing protein [Enhydrobacter sp.]WIM12213.1 MAG: hypothetical protein OJF58_003174 [Enhydrobacter sp.]